MKNLTYNKEANLRQLGDEIIADGFVLETDFFGISYGSGITVVYVRDDMSQEDINKIGVVVENHVPGPSINDTHREKKYKVALYNSTYRLETEIWYDTDNGDGTYSGKAEETAYTYQGNSLIYKIHTIYFYDGTVDTQLKTEYFKDQNKVISKESYI